MLHIILYTPEIPQNTGNIGRMCAITQSALHLIHPLGFSIDDKAIRRSGMDYWKQLTLFNHKNWESFQTATSRPRRIWLFTTRSKQSYWDVEFRSGDGLLFGSEGHGVPEEVHQCIGHEFSVTLPHNNPNTRSLNLATSAGIACYEALRQLR